MRRRRAVLAASAVALLGVLSAHGPTVAVAQTAINPNVSPTMGQAWVSLLPPMVDGKALPGVTVLARAKGLGTATATTDVASQVAGRPPMTDAATQAVFEIGSLTKVFTGLVAAVLVEEGRLTLTTKLGDMLGAELDGAAQDVLAITVAQLLTHRSCLPRLSEKVISQAKSDAYAGISSGDLWLDLRKQPSLDRRDCSEAYSNFGMAVLGQAMAVHLKTTYADLVHARVTQPLGMKDTRVPGPNGSTRLVEAFDGSTPSLPWTFDAYAPAGGMHSTARDLVTLAQAYVTPPEGALGRAVVRSMQPLSSSKMARAMGWGVFINGEGDQASYLHDGRTQSFKTQWAVKPSSREAFVVLTSNVKATTQVARVVTNEWYPLSSTSSAAANTAPTEAVTTPPAGAVTLGALTGVYAIDDNARFTFVVHQGRLWGRLTNQGFNPLEATGPLTFVLREVGAEFVFAADAKSVVLKQGGNTVPGKRTGPAPTQAIMDDAQAAGFAGTYKHPQATFVVRANRGQLVVKLDSQPFIGIYPVDAATDSSRKAVQFDYEAVKASIVFERDEQGRVQSLTLLQNGQRIKALREQL
jgi:serine-type D-Ala-D-Ala carboxypeptidase/endopeptidase